MAPRLESGSSELPEIFWRLDYENLADYFGGTDVFGYAGTSCTPCGETVH